MRKIIFRILLFSVIISCNDNDDGINVSNGINIRTELDVVKITETLYSGGSPTGYNVTILGSRRITSDTIYDLNRELVSYRRWNYDFNELLVSIHHFDNTNTLVESQSKFISYDDQNRLTKVQQGVSPFYEYAYSDDRTMITETSSTGENATFSINAFGRIHKVTRSMEEAELFYTNAQVDSLIVTNSSTSMVTNKEVYKYINAFEPKGFLMSDIMKKTFRSQNNAVLFYRTLNNTAPIYSEKYFARTVIGVDNRTFEYTLDTDLYPTIYNTFVNGNFSSSFELTYD